MNATLTHLGQSFTVEVKTDEHADTGPYVITNQRGARFVLCRNQPKPELLFAIRIEKMKVPRNWWFTDKDGTLRSLTP